MKEFGDLEVARPRERSPTLRSKIFSLHGWLGLHLAIYFALVILSGTFLTIGKEIAFLGRPEMWVPVQQGKQDAPFSEVYANLMADDPDRQVYVMMKSATAWLAGEAFTVSGDGRREVIRFNRYDGTLVGKGQSGKFVVIVEGIHRRLLVPIKQMELVVNSTALVLLVSIITGLIAYRRFWRGFFRWPSRATTGKLRIGAYHRLIAVWTAPFLIVVSLTSGVFLLEGLGMKSTPQPTKELSIRDERLPPGFGPSTIAAAEAKASEVFENFKTDNLVFPNSLSDGLSIGGWHVGQRLIEIKSDVVIDPATLEVVRISNSNELPRQVWLTRLSRQIHYGIWGGRVSQPLWAAFGLASGMLMLTGALVYSARTARAAPTTIALRRAWLGLGIMRWAYFGLAIFLILRAVQIVA